MQFRRGEAVADPNDVFDVLGDYESTTIAPGGAVPRPDHWIAAARDRSGDRKALGSSIARIVSNVPATGTFAATLTLKKKCRAKLRQATRVTKYVVVACVAADGSTPASARKIVLRA